MQCFTLFRNRFPILLITKFQGQFQNYANSFLLVFQILSMQRDLTACYSSANGHCQHDLNNKTSCLRILLQKL